MTRVQCRINNKAQEVTMPAQMGTGASQGPKDPRKKETSAFHYFRAVQADLNKRFNKVKGMVKKKSPAKEK